MTAEQPSFQINQLLNIEQLAQLRPVLASTIVDRSIVRPQAQPGTDHAPNWVLAEVNRELGEIESAVNTSDSTHFVATLAGITVGVMGFRSHQRNADYPAAHLNPAELLHAHVSAEHQQRGYGGALLGRTIAEATAAGYDELVVLGGRWERWGNTGFMRHMFERFTFVEDAHGPQYSPHMWREELSASES